MMSSKILRMRVQDIFRMHQSLWDLRDLYVDQNTEETVLLMMMIQDEEA